MFGTFGTATGLQAALATIGREPEKWRFLVGLQEALNNFVLSLGFVIVDLLLLAVLPGRAAPNRHMHAPAPSPASGQSQG